MGVESPASIEDVRHAFDRALRTGGLQRLPRNPAHRDIVLAALCLGLRRRHAYGEPELNDRLKDALAGMRAAVDHVTCRRFLVDLGFLRRDRAGTRYFVDPSKLADTLTGEAAAALPAILAHALPPGRR